MDRITFRNVLRSWIFVPNEIIVTFVRNYNKKEASLFVDYKTTRNIQALNKLFK